MRNIQEKNMHYKVKIAGKVFKGSDTRALIRLAVAARREATQQTEMKNYRGTQSS